MYVNAISTRFTTSGCVRHTSNLLLWTPPQNCSTCSGAYSISSGSTTNDLSQYGNTAAVNWTSVYFHWSRVYNSASCMPDNTVTNLCTPLSSQQVATTQSPYRFGFNGQEKDDEITGYGDDYTAMYWEYDARLG